MKFFIDYNVCLEHKQIIYRKDEYSFDTTPYIYEFDFEIEINTIFLTVVDSKIIQLNGFCGLSEKNLYYDVPKAKKGTLKLLHSEKYIFSAGTAKLNDKDWKTFINPQTGWACIGEPQRQGYTVEFIDNCIAVVDKNQELIALWIHPFFL